MRYFEVHIAERPEFSRRIYTTTRGRAKYRYLNDVREVWPSLGFQHLSVRAVSPIILPPRLFVRGREQLLPEVTARLVRFLEALPAFTRAQWEHSYPLWSKGGDAWHIAGLGGTCITLALLWYHHVHAGGSQRHESSPPVILRALIALAAPEYLTPPRKTP